MCRYCLDTGLVVYGSDTETGRRIMKCGCGGKDAAEVRSDECGVQPDVVELVVLDEPVVCSVDGPEKVWSFTTNSVKVYPAVGWNLGSR